jgi:NTP pyrophosphatase (non-canonical NTP hydrolase)
MSANPQAALDALRSTPTYDRVSVSGLSTFAAWEAEVARLGKHYDPTADTAVKDALGLAGEVGEVVELIKKDRFQAQPLDREKLCLELGDVLWYLTNMAAGFGLTLEQIASANREKLRRRYPDSFTPGGGIR